MIGAWERAGNGAAWTLGVTLLVLIFAPFVALGLQVDAETLRAGTAHPLFWPAVRLSLGTSAVSLVIIVLGGTPLAWWLSRPTSALRRFVGVAVDLPIVVPPAVVGLALLTWLGRRSVVGGWLDAAGLGMAFTDRAVVLAQVVVAAPFYVQTVASAFRRIDEAQLLVARTLGAGPIEAVVRIAIPSALPGVIAGVSLAWARALGEFGATLVFAGSLPGETQTMPLAILAALEVDVRLAVVFALALAVAAALVIGVSRGVWRSGDAIG